MCPSVPTYLWEIYIFVLMCVFFLPPNYTKMWINSTLESEACCISHKNNGFPISTTDYEKIFTEICITLENQDQNPKLILN